MPADADDARRRCVEWGRLRCPMLTMLASIALKPEYLGPSCRFTCIIRLLPTMLAVATADADDARTPSAEYNRLDRLMLMMCACIACGA